MEAHREGELYASEHGGIQVHRRSSPCGARLLIETAIRIATASPLMANHKPKTPMIAKKRTAPMATVPSTLASFNAELDFVRDIPLPFLFLHLDSQDQFNDVELRTTTHPPIGANSGPHIADWFQGSYSKKIEGPHKSQMEIVMWVERRGPYHGNTEEWQPGVQRNSLPADSFCRTTSEQTS